jgi:hypothetical protein
MTKRMTLALFWAAMLVAATVAHAATGDGYEIPELEAKTQWISIGVSVLALAGIVIVAFKNPHRSHLD